ncbi:MAG: ABC transporter ATP-binding protein [Actinomycetaceae bacterium]|nr:ABC transporter ATP-binding protein [Actinomycetaceae bacterium]
MLLLLCWQYLRTRLRDVALILFLQVAAALAGLNLPDINARIIDEGVATGSTGVIWSLGGLMLAIALVQGVCTALAVWFGAKVSMGLGAWLRHRVFTHAQRLSIQDVHHYGAPSLITRSTNDVQHIQMVVLMSFSIMVTAPIMGIGGVIQAVRQNLELSGVLAVLIPLLIAIFGILSFKLYPIFGQLQVRTDEINTVLREELTGIRVIRAFARIPFISDRYRTANDNLRDVSMILGAIFAVLFPLVGLVVNAANVAVVWFGAGLVDSGQANIGALFAFLNYVGMIFMAVMLSSMVFMMVPRASVCAQRIHEILDHQPTVFSPETGKKADSPELSSQWSFALDNASMQYPGAESAVLENIDLPLPAGTTTAIIGATGAGKTTLVNLLPRLMDPTGGHVLANGIPVDQIDLGDLRGRIAVVPQRAHLFSGTIASAVSCSNDLDEAGRERVRWALAGAQALEFVDRLEDGIDSPVEPGGKNFSGGQRQRLCIARALYRQADLYIFDDSFSALDQATDAALRRGLPEYVGNAAVVVVAQRVASIRTADVIIVLDHGQIVGRGRHEDLLQTCPTYKEIVDSQASSEEAA